MRFFLLSGYVRLPSSLLSLWPRLFWHEDEDTNDVAVGRCPNAGQSFGRQVYEGRHMEYARALDWSAQRQWVSLIESDANPLIVTILSPTDVIIFCRRRLPASTPGLVIIARTSTTVTLKHVRFAACRAKILSLRFFSNSLGWKFTRVEIY